MTDIDGLIAMLEKNLERTKWALNERLKLQVELQKQPDTPLEELQQIEAEISTLRNSANQTELAIASLSGRMQSGGFDEFGIDFRPH